MRQNLFDPVKNGQWQVLWTNNPFQRYNSQLQYNPYFNKTYKNDDTSFKHFINEITRPDVKLLDVYTGTPKGVDMANFKKNLRNEVYSLATAGNDEFYVASKGTYLRDAAGKNIKIKLGITNV